MNKLYKIISLLLTYPSKELQDCLPDLKLATSEVKSDNATANLLDQLVDDLSTLDLYDAQERYVFLFDRTRSLSLHLFEHVHGESRDRGQAMVDLMAMYEADGYEIDARELPDHLPLFLEYLSLKPEDEAKELLGQILHIVTALRTRLKKRKSVYANAFLALETLARKKADKSLLSKLLSGAEDDPDDLEALDKIWEEEVVTFGGNAGENACGPDRLRMQMRASQRKPQEVGTTNSALEN